MLKPAAVAAPEPEELVQHVLLKSKGLWHKPPVSDLSEKPKANSAKFDLAITRWFMS